MKIIGSGLIGNAFKERTIIDSIYPVILFASGVSNSSETNPKSFLREKKLLESILETKKRSEKLVYFSTLSIYDKHKKEAAYIKHKQNIEEVIHQKSQNYLIIRVPNIIGKGGNPNTLLNYLVAAVKGKREIKIFKNAYRNFIDVEDLVKLIEELLISDAYNTTIDLLHPVSYSMLEVINYIEKHINTISNSVYLEQGYNYFPLSNLSINSIFEMSNVNIRKNYLSQILKKYY